jgi:hypothetical protein
MLVVIPIQASGEEDLEDSPERIWTTINSYQFEMQILPGENDGVSLDGLHGSVLSPTGHYGLPRECWEALDMVPQWLYDDLLLKFRVLPPEPSIALAMEIVDANGSETMDEIAFTVAHLSVQTITNEYFFPEIITHNAELVYSHDDLVPFAEIVEKEDYTTIVYNTTEGELELPRDIYYWYVVHPDLGDELPTYVDPDYNYAEDQPRDRDYGVPPPEGKFWREWFFVNNKSGQPLLPDILNETETLLDGIKAVNRWIDQSMTFTSDNERPNQPVRIYEKGIGRCGEYQDLRTSAGRASLLPVVPTSNSAEDHVWNEFWSGRWIHWDGMIDNPTAYERGWGKTLSTVWNQRGDGYTWDVTDTYTETATIDVEVVDQRGLPADGTLVELKTEMFYMEDLKTTTNFATTDHTGKLSFKVGDRRNYWGVSDGGDLGKDPLNPNLAPTEIAMNTTMGGFYDIKFELPRAANSNIPIENDQDYPYEFEADISFTVVDHVTRGRNTFTGDVFEDKGEGGDITAMVMDRRNGQAHDTGAPFSAHYYEERVESDSFGIPLPEGENLILLFDNQYSQKTVKTINVTIEIRGYITSFFDLDSYDFELGEEILLGGEAYSGRDIEEVHAMIEGVSAWEEANIVEKLGERRSYFWGERFETGGLEPGPYTAWCRAWDNETYHYSSRLIYINDTTPPVLDIYSMPSGPYTENDMITIEGTALDAHRIEDLYYLVDGDRSQRFDMKLPQEDQWVLTLDLSDIGFGDHTISINAEDPSGNMGTVRMELDIIEAELPVVNVDRPEDGTLWRLGETITFEGSASDNLEVESLEFLVNGRKVYDMTSLIQTDGGFLYQWNSGTTGGSHGINRIEVRAQDPSGNEFGFPVEIELDGDDPDLDLFSNGTVLFGPSSPYFLEGNTVDENGISILEWSFDGIVFEDITSSIRGGGDFELELDSDIGSEEGDLELIIRSHDGVGNTEEKKLSLFYDPNGPMIDISPLPEFVMKGENVTVRGTVEDPSGIGETIISASGIGEIEREGEMSTYPFSVDIDTSDMRTGEVTFTIEAMDQLGNWNEEEITTRLITETTDSDGDRMPDWWEDLYGTDPDERDGDGDLDNDGYTNLQEYLGRDGRTGNDDFSDPNDPSSIPKAARKSSGSDNSLTILILILAGTIGLAGAFFIVVRLTKRT